MEISADLLSLALAPWRLTRIANRGYKPHDLGTNSLSKVAMAKRSVIPAM